MSLKSFHICLCSSWIWSWGPMFADTWAVFVDGGRWCLLKRGLGEGPPLTGLAFCLAALMENIGSTIISFPVENLLLCLHSLVSSSSLVSSHGIFMAIGYDSHGQGHGLYTVLPKATSVDQGHNANCFQSLTRKVQKLRAFYSNLMLS